jgi:hypothetical protein
VVFVDGLRGEAAVALDAEDVSPAGRSGILEAAPTPRAVPVTGSRSLGNAPSVGRGWSE